MDKSKVKYKVYQLFLLFIIASILGYIYECITTYFKTGIFYKDTGFSCLPILPIYGFGVVILYILFGTPKDMRILHKKIFTKDSTLYTVYRYILYFILTALVATLFEIAVGLIFEYAFGEILWSYETLPFNFTRYACLQISILWGVGATLIMSLLFDRLYLVIQKIPEYRLYKAINVFLFIWSLDIVFNFGYYYTTGAMFTLIGSI